MLITKEIFCSFLDCETKAFLKMLNENEFESRIVEWKQSRLSTYKKKCLASIRENYQKVGHLTDEILQPQIESNKYDLVLDSVWQTNNLRSRIDAVELKSDQHGGKKIPSPIIFIPNEKITNNDRLQLAFDALVITYVHNIVPSMGKIIYGQEQKVTKVKLGTLIDTVKTIVEKIIAQLAESIYPQIILNKHCSECEFRLRCRKLAIEKDELTLLSGMSEKERNKLHNKGIFTVTQLSYTYRARRRPKHSTVKQEKYSYALKALAVREKKIYIVGKPELPIKGTPVFLDVEGVPEQDFYYLIGLHVNDGNSYIQKSFWANSKSDEKKIWVSFLEYLAKISEPLLIHYGSYETVFLKRMRNRYSDVADSFPFLTQIVSNAINLLSLIYARIYFPTHSNGLKDIAQYLGFEWSDPTVTGLSAIIWRSGWESSKKPSMKQKLVTYNDEDCTALEKTTNFIYNLCEAQTENNSNDFIRVDELKPENPYHFGNPIFSIPDLADINRAAYWDYQRSKVYIRSSKRLKRVRRDSVNKPIKSPSVSKTIELDQMPSACPKCGGAKLYRNGRKSRIIYNIKFSCTAIKRWIVRYCYCRYKCPHCKASFFTDTKLWTRSKYGWEIQSYVIYQILDLKLSGRSVIQSLNHLFDLGLNKSVVQMFKKNLAEYYKDTFETILQRIIDGNLLQADETKISIRNKDVYVWVLTNLEEVIYLFSETREVGTIKSLLGSFKGVLVSDFYAAYDTIECPQQKCLIHLIRDLNDDLLKQPFNEELKNLAYDFSTLLKPIIETIDQYGLKARFLKKHKFFVERFFKNISTQKYESDLANKYKKRFAKNTGKLFTFLDYDGVPWNNNNAETAIKALARLRKSVEGPMSEKGIRESLTLLSIRETCKYKGINFLDFLCSREKDIDIFIWKNDK